MSYNNNNYNKQTKTNTKLTKKLWEMQLQYYRLAGYFVNIPKDKKGGIPMTGPI